MNGKAGNGIGEGKGEYGSPWWWLPLPFGLMCKKWEGGMRGGRVDKIYNWPWNNGGKWDGWKYVVGEEANSNGWMDGVNE